VEGEKGYMIHFAEMTDDERFNRLERGAAEIRKMLLGVLFMMKEVWKDDLAKREEGIEILSAMEKAEESFTKRSEPDRLKRLEHTLDVINERVKSIFDLMSYISKDKENNKPPDAN
jgi:hypothetical protein